MVKFLPLEAVTTVPSDPGHETAVKVLADVCAVVVEVPVLPFVIVVVELPSQLGFW